MKRSLIWILICIVCISILIGFGRVAFKDIELSQYLINVFKSKGIREYSLWEEKKMKENPNYKNLAIFIDINSKTLELINLENNKVVKKYLIASGKTSTPSPVGSWKIINKGRWGRGFGTRWMGLNVPWGKCK